MTALLRPSPAEEDSRRRVKPATGAIGSSGTNAQRCGLPTIQDVRWLLLALSVLIVACPAAAVDFFFQPDSAEGNVPDTVLFSGRIAASDTMRGFTVYLGYDTTKLKFAGASAGSLIAGRQGLQFFAYDHTPANPERLDVGASVYSTDYWAGPGELFTVRFALRRCGDVPIIAPYNPRFVAPNGSLLPWSFEPAVALICERVPAPPQGLTVSVVNLDSLQLLWRPVVCDTLGRALLQPPQYGIYQQQIRPVILPPVLVDMVTDTGYQLVVPNSTECIYHVMAQTP
jgi:hypothetical protein